MGISFRRKAPQPSVAAANTDAPVHALASHRDTLKALIGALLREGSFVGGLDHNPAFAKEQTEDGLQIAQNDTDLTLCIMADRVSGFSVVHMTSDQMVHQIVNPVMKMVFDAEPTWESDDAAAGTWRSRHEIGSGLTLLMDCKEGPAELAKDAGTRQGATVTLQVLMQH